MFAQLTKYTCKMIHEFDGVPNPKQLEKLLTEAIADMMKNGVGAVAINLGDLQCDDPDCECKANVTPADGSQIGKISEPVVEDDEEAVENTPVLFGFSEVIKVLEKGGRAWRDSWDKNGSFFIFRQVPAEVPIMKVADMTSLPRTVKETLLYRALDNDHKPPFTSIRYDNQYALVLNDNTIESWSPGVDDLRALDWHIEH